MGFYFLISHVNILKRHAVLLLIMDVTDFKEEVLPLKNKLYRFALTIVKDDDLAKDVVQECLIKVWEKREEVVFVKILKLGACRSQK